MATRSVSRPPWLEQDAPIASKSSGGCTSDSSTNFEFLNDKLARPIETRTPFHLFEQLPLELRRCIWQFSLPQQRMLRVTVAAAQLAHGQSNGPTVAPYQSKNDLGNIVSGANYHLRLRSTDTISPLLYVNHEAKDVVHHGYRVHIPITQPVPSSDAPVLRFCPERDTIFITVEREQDKAYFADFVHDALAYDPKNKGIQHRAIADRESSIHLPIKLPNLHSRVQAALARTLGSLESVSLVHLYHTSRRQMFFNVQHHVYINTQLTQTEMIRLKRAYPLWSTAASYSMLPVDPCPVSRYLDLVDCQWDPRRLIRAWRMLEAAYDVPPTSPDRIRLLLGATDDDENSAIATTFQACYYRQQEELYWAGNWEQRGYFTRHYIHVTNPDTKVDLEFAQKQNAIGFWSVPLEAFGPVPEVPYEDYKWPMWRICDFTAFESQIELGLFAVT